MPRRVFLVRHGETAWNAEGRWQGRRDVPLSERGREQARALGLRLAGEAFAAAYCSALGRARETAELATGGRLSVTPVTDLAEIAYGEWEGVQDSEVHARWPDLRRTWSEAPHEVQMIGGERLTDVEARVVPALEGALRETAGDVLVVAHGGVNRILVGHVLRLPLASFWRLQQDPSAVNVLQLPDAPDPADALRRGRVMLWNCTAHLR